MSSIAAQNAPRILKTISAVRRWRKTAPSPVVLVPTMGALHAGHGDLIRRARSKAGKRGSVVVSIFVNPTQFGPREDFSAYPRSLKSDLDLCRSSGASAVFVPEVSEMYHSDRSISVEESELSNHLCGKSRPGHFRGVCTVVAKLFLIVQPDSAIFGEKDWQQLAILRRMTRDLNFPVEIEGFPTVREKDGLARSSRNQYLTTDERAAAPRIYQTLLAAAVKRTPSAVVSTARTGIERIPGARIDYVEAVDAENLQPLKNRRSSGRLAVAVFLGRARLIDNIALPALA